MKLCDRRWDVLIVESPPSRGRGLKQVCDRCLTLFDRVAPFTGAWIET